VTVVVVVAPPLLQHPAQAEKQYLHDWQGPLGAFKNRPISFSMVFDPALETDVGDFLRCGACALLGTVERLSDAFGVSQSAFFERVALPTERPRSFPTESAVSQKLFQRSVADWKSKMGRGRKRAQECDITFSLRVEGALIQLAPSVRPPPVTIACK
jgi:hypothetical protein